MDDIAKVGCKSRLSYYTLGKGRCQARNWIGMQELQGRSSNVRRHQNQGGQKSSEVFFTTSVLGKVLFEHKR